MGPITKIIIISFPVLIFSYGRNSTTHQQRQSRIYVVVWSSSAALSSLDVWLWWVLSLVSVSLSIRRRVHYDELCGAARDGEQSGGINNIPRPFCQTHHHPTLQPMYRSPVCHRHLVCPRHRHVIHPTLPPRHVTRPVFVLQHTHRYLCTSQCAHNSAS